MFHVLCVLATFLFFVVQSVNGVLLLLVQMVGAPTIDMCAMKERDTSGFAGGAHGFTTVCFFHVGVCRREQESSNTMLR